jgi:hypothetical protein
MISITRFRRCDSHVTPLTEPEGYGRWEETELSAEPPVIRSSRLHWLLMMHKVKGLAMHIEQRVAGGLMSVLCLGILLGALILPLQAGDRAAQLAGGKHVPRGGVQPGVPQAGGSPYAPPAFIDRGTPISERPFAKPFIDRSSPISERPLAPLGGGPQVAPGSVPLIWCHGVWVRADNPGHGCSWR